MIWRQTALARHDWTLLLDKHGSMISKTSIKRSSVDSFQFSPLIIFVYLIKLKVKFRKKEPIAVCFIDWSIAKQSADWKSQIDRSELDWSVFFTSGHLRFHWPFSEHPSSGQSIWLLIADHWRFQVDHRLTTRNLIGQFLDQWSLPAFQVKWNGQLKKHKKVFSFEWIGLDFFVMVSEWSVEYSASADQ